MLWAAAVALALALIITIVRGAAEIGYWKSMLLAPEPDSCAVCELGTAQAGDEIEIEKLCLRCHAAALGE